MHQKRSFGLAWLYFKRAMRLQCPTCGTRPIFLPLLKTRTLRDWFTPLDGCPRCGYPYEREPGYYLMSIWALNYGCGGILGVALYVLLRSFFDWSILHMILAVVIPVAVFNLAFARHSKSLFLAMDLFWDPHERRGGDDGGNRPAQSPPHDGSPQTGKPIPEAPVPTGGGNGLPKLSLND